MRTSERSRGRNGQLVLRRALAFGMLGVLLAGCADEGERTPLQQVDWRNGPYALSCSPDESSEYVDGRTVRQDGEEGRTDLNGVGYAELDGREGDEAILTHLCATGSASLSVWTGSDDGPRLLGAVEEPEGYADVRDWGADRGILCVMFNLGDVPGSGAEARPVAVSTSGLDVLVDQSCEVDGVSAVEEQDFG